MTKGLYTGSDDFVRCSAHVKYRGRSGQCERRAMYPDIDGIRWWCGLHNPNRKKAQEKKAQTEVVSVAPTAVPTEVSPDIVEAMRKAKDALTEVANAKAIGWPEATPAENYRVLLKHLNELAAEGRQALASALREIERPPVNAG